MITNMNMLIDIIHEIALQNVVKTMQSSHYLLIMSK